VGGREGRAQKPKERRGAPAGGVEVDQRQVVGLGSQKERISNFGKNGRIHLQARREIGRAGQGKSQKLLQQEKNQFFHVVLFGRKRETKVDG
jgi:hypothetical protein